MSQQESQIIMNDIQSENKIQIVYVYRQYESQKRAVKKYQETHKDEFIYKLFQNHKKR
jgi:hypothetical protein